MQMLDHLLRFYTKIFFVGLFFENLITLHAIWLGLHSLMIRQIARRYYYVILNIYDVSRIIGFKDLIRIANNAKDFMDFCFENWKKHFFFFLVDVFLISKCVKGIIKIQ